MASPSAHSAPLSSEIPRVASMQMDDGSSVVASYFGDDGSVLFGVTHTPAAPNGQGVVMCSPVYNDYLKNNRREVLLARRLASEGFTVQRFNYAGTGNSEGEILDLSVDTMTNDAAAATRFLQGRDGVEHVSFMGTRLGALPAATSAAQADAPVAFWEPIEGVKYFRELFRTMAIIEMDSDGGGATVTELKERFERDGWMDSAGFAVGSTMQKSATAGLVDTLGASDASVFLAQFREKPELKAEYANAVTAWEDQGRTITNHYVLVEEAWMLFVYGFRAEEDRAHSQDLIEATVTWFRGLA